jgi:hypothetical protein
MLLDMGAKGLALLFNLSTEAITLAYQAREFSG